MTLSAQISAHITFFFGYDFMWKKMMTRDTEGIFSYLAFEGVKSGSDFKRSHTYVVVFYTIATAGYGGWFSRSN